MVECFPLGSSSIGRTSGMWVLGLAVSLGDAWALHRVVLRPPAGLPPEQHLRELPVAGAQGASANSLQAFWGRFSAGFTQAFCFPTFRKRDFKRVRISAAAKRFVFWNLRRGELERGVPGVSNCEPLRARSPSGRRVARRVARAGRGARGGGRHAGRPDRTDP